MLISIGGGTSQRIKANALAALYQPELDENKVPRFNCATGNCTWGAFTTISFCPSCADVTPFLNKTCSPYKSTEGGEWGQECEVSLPGEYTTLTFRLEGDSYSNGDRLVVSSTESPVVYRDLAEYRVYQSISAKLDTPLFEGLPFRNNTKLEATECVMQPCVLSLTASVSKGEYSEKVLDTYMQSPDANHTCGFDVMRPPWGPEEGMQPNETFGFVHQQICSAALALPDTLIAGKVSVSTLYNNSFVSSEGGLCGGENGDGVEVIFNTQITASTHPYCAEPRNAFSCVFQSMARGVAKGVRDTSYYFTNSNATNWALGETLTTAVFIQVQWWWISLPLTVWLLSLITLGGAMWETRRAGWPLWRDDPLPLVFMRRDEGMIDGLSKRFGGVSTLAHEARGENVVVRGEIDRDRVNLTTRWDD